MNVYTIKFLIQLKNATIARKEKIITPYNKLSLELVKCLYKEGFIQSFEIKESRIFENKIHFEIIVLLRFFFNKGLLNDLKIISKPSLTRYLTFKDICKIASKKTVTFLSTSHGILTNTDCKKKQVGGTLLFTC